MVKLSTVRARVVNNLSWASVSPASRQRLASVSPASPQRLLSLLAAALLNFLACSSDGQVVAWGDNYYGQLNVPASATNVVALAGGDDHALALRRDGTVVAWGVWGYGLTNVPPDLTNAVGIAAGSSHSLALRSDGTLTLWGRIMSSGETNVPPNATNIIALALGPGAQHALVLRADGTPLDWGGIGSYLTSIPTSARNLVAVAAGNQFAVGLRADGRVVVWGWAPLGAANVPASATNIVGIATGWNSVTAVRADGSALVWVASAPSAGFTNLAELVITSGMYNTMIGLRRNGTLAANGGLPQYPTNQIAAIAGGSDNGYAAVGSGPPFFPGFPVNRTVPSGSRAYFRLSVVGAMPISYQWTCESTNVPGATNPVLTLTNVQPSQSGAYYRLVASNSLGMATSGPVLLTALASEVAVQPQALRAFPGTDVTFTGSVLGQGPFAYQWQFGGTNLDGATTNSLSLTNVQMNQTGTYSLLVSNVYGVVTNTEASLNVVPFPAFQGITQTTGMVTLTWSATAGQTFQLQYCSDLAARNWSNLGTAITATNSAIQATDAIGPAPGRYYRLSVTQ